MSSLRRNRDFVALWVGQTASSLGISISSFAYPLVVLGATGSPAKAGLVGSVLTTTTFFLRLPAGALVDRWDRKTIMILCDAGRALAAASFALALGLGHFFLLHVLAVAFVEGSLGVLFGPSELGAVRRVVAPEQIRDAVARNQIRGYVAGLLGPPLGGVLLGISRALPFLADAVSYLVSLVCVLLVRASLKDPPRERLRRRIVAEVFDGVRWLWRHRFLRALVLWIAGGGVAYSSIGLVILVLARERGASSEEIGALFALTAGGGVVGALAAPRLLRALPSHVLVIAFGAVAACASLLLAVTQSPYVMGALGAAAFVLAPSVNALVFATIAAEAPEGLQGRANSAAIQLTNIAAPLGPLVAGVLVTQFGAAPTIVAYGVLLTALTSIAAASPGLRSPRLRDGSV